MKLNSLAFRLFAAAALWTALALPVAGFLIYSLYKQEVARDFNDRLSVLLTVITADSLDHVGAEPGAPSEVGEPLFAIKQSGHYWQITPIGKAPGTPLRSPSLGQENIPLLWDRNVKPDPRDPNLARWSDLPGPYGETVRITETIRSVGEMQPPRLYAFSVAKDLTWLDRRVSAFRSRLVLSLALAGIGLLAVTFLQVHFGLQPLAAIERGLAAIRSGNAARLEGTLPTEIQPLQHEINALIQSNQEVIDRARTQVGNLAHALKTPLAVITNEARDDKSMLGGKVAAQADIMRQQISHYLDRARVAAGVMVIGRVTDVRPVAEALCRALERIYRDRGIAYALDCPRDLKFLGEKHDLEEMLGNLLDNAGKWATSRVRLSAELLAGEGSTGRMLQIKVEDDGPGLSPEQLQRGVKRGQRLDESKPGSGLGLSIVADLAHSYRGNFIIAKAGLGGLEAKLSLPGDR